MVADKKFSDARQVKMLQVLTLFEHQKAAKLKTYSKFSINVNMASQNQISKLDMNF